MLGDQVTGTPIVDAHQVMLAAFWERHDAAVKQHNRDASLLERFDDRLVGLVLCRCELQGRKEHPADISLDILMTQL